MIFVDTSAWFAAFVPTDRNHGSAIQVFASTPSQLLVTTDYILNETLTLLKMRGEAIRAMEIGRPILEERLCRLIWVEKNDVFKAWTFFESHRDKDWSFTDCVSRTIIDRLKIKEAFAFDAHFRQFGDLIVLP